MAFSAAILSQVGVERNTPAPEPGKSGVKRGAESWIQPYAFGYQDEGGDFVYTGPYVVDHFEPEDHIDLIPNVHYPQVDERSNIEVKKFEDGNALAQALEAGEVSF